MNKKPEFDESTLGISPFSFTFQIEATKVIESGVFVNVYDEETNTTILMPRGSIREKIQSTKLYHCPGCKDIIYNLSPGAKSLFIYLVYNIDSSKDHIWLNMPRYMQKNSIKSINTAKTAIQELIRYSIIAMTGTKEVYWINPKIFFSGDRVKKFEKNVIVKNTWEQ